MYLDTNSIEDPATWNRRSPAEIEATLLRLGIRHDTTVIVYGRDTVGDANEKWPGRRAGQIAASRAALILRYAGVEDVRLLDGGYDWWVTDGHPLETVPRTPEPVADFGVTIPQHPEYLVDLPEAKEILADQEGAALVSVRTWREHIGAVSGYNYIGPAGRIKGDVWGNCGTDAYHMQHYRNVDNTMRAYPEILANWAEADVTADKWVAFYCGTGWRAAETWFYADLLDWPRIAVYDGGWFEWSADPVNNPIELGVPAEKITRRRGCRLIDVDRGAGASDRRPRLGAFGGQRSIVATRKSSTCMTPSILRTSHGIARRSRSWITCGSTSRTVPAFRDR